MAGENSRPKFVCPECERAGIETTFYDNRGVASHRRSKHGVFGTSPAVVAARKAKQKMGQRVGRPPGPGRGNYERPAKNSTAVRSEPAAPFAPSLIGYAAGRVQGLVEQIARENGVPEKQFLTEVALSIPALFGQ